MKDFLKNVALFAKLPDNDLETLANMVETIKVESGEFLFSEGDLGDSAYIIESGQIEITKHTDGEEVLLAVVGSGDVIGEMALLDEAPRMASAKARSGTTLLSISQSQLDQLLNSSSSATRALLYTITNRWRETEGLLMQSEKMAQLGTLTAGMAHELNNPASAVRRGASQIRDAFLKFQDIHFDINRSDANDEHIDELKALNIVAKDRAENPVHIDSLERSDKEYALETQLEAQGVENAWEYTSALVNLGFESDSINELNLKVGQAQLQNTISWLSSTSNLHGLLLEIGQGSRHISNVVRALKTYAYQETAPLQEVDIHASIEETLLLMDMVVGSEINIVQDFQETLPKIQAYQSELGQVWANVIKNSVDAIKETSKTGVIHIRTQSRENTIQIEFEDNGPGIPIDIQNRVFDPFFTTKPPGHGVGLGLNISYNIIKQNHHGEIGVVSKPGRTVFTIKLPIDLRESSQGATSSSVIQRSGDKTLTSIFTDIKSIAVVGISSRDNQPANFVPKYLLSQGYTIYPVNPNIGTIMGLQVYASLKEIPE
ncbi:MAG: cyclic nucleotide-binding domain-containing protein, partial [Chloroflexota bacterium]